MAIKAVFKPGETKTSVQGLYQWDYGQVLEVESPDLIVSNVEVHFSCDTMNEAIVRNCSVLNGVVSAVIPDSCLEQASNVTAWVYVIDGTQGHTALTVTLPIIARKRPSTTDAPTQEHTSKYEELITEVNEAVSALKTGAVVVKRALDADDATYATTAGNASTAGFAQTSATADKDKEGNKLVDAYHLNTIGLGNTKYFTGKNVDIDALYKPSQCGVYTINWDTTVNYSVTTLPNDFPTAGGACKLIVEADYNDDTNPTVFQTLKIRSNENKGLLIWTRIHGGETWGEWRRFVSAEELTDGTLVPQRARCSYDGKFLSDALYKGGDYINEEYLVDGYAPLNKDTATNEMRVRGGIISFLVFGKNAEGSYTSSANIIVELFPNCFYYDPMAVSQYRSNSFTLDMAILTSVKRELCNLVFEKKSKYVTNSEGYSVLDYEYAVGVETLSPTSSTPIEWTSVDTDRVFIFYKYLAYHPTLADR